jgi:hypothetical protein
MNPEIKEVVVEQPIDTNVQTPGQSKGLINNLLKKFTENKMYMYIAIGIIVLAVVAFYYFKKCKKDVKNKNQLPLPKQSNAPSTGLNNDDHFILDTNGNPVKVTGSFSNQLLPLPIPKQQPSQKDVQMLQKQMYEKQMMQQQNVASQKPKLQHPESEMSDEIEIDLDDIEDNEDENVAQHNLTNSELAEINKKIEMMNPQK